MQTLLLLMLLGQAGSAAADKDADEGAASAFLNSVIAEIQAAHPTCAATPDSGMRLRLSCSDPPHELQLNLARTWQACQASPDDCEVRRDLVAAVDRALAPPVAATPDTVRAVIRSADWIARLPDDVREHTRTEPFLADLVVVYMVDAPESAHSLTVEDAAGLGLTSGQLLNLVQENTQSNLHDVHDRRVFGMHVVDGYYASSLLLLSGYWETAGGGAPVWACAASAEQLLYSKREKDKAILCDLASKLSTDARDPLPPVLLAWRGGQWSVSAP